MSTICWSNALASMSPAVSPRAAMASDNPVSMDLLRLPVGSRLERRRLINSGMDSMEAETTLSILGTSSLSSSLSSDVFTSSISSLLLRPGGPKGGGEPPKSNDATVGDADRFFLPCFLSLGVSFGVAIGIGVVLRNKLAFCTSIRSSYVEEAFTKYWSNWSSRVNSFISSSSLPVLFDNVESKAPTWSTLANGSVVSLVESNVTDVTVVDPSLISSPNCCCCCSLPKKFKFSKSSGENKRSVITESAAINNP
mmetsp:Transcript_32184/g.67652  ORF Transcript_32184/g.67652 Transcript_32184/m.67652 type:complete len:253 (-) Transcript_32184:1257-2015(-)